MKIEQINTVETVILRTPADRSPIWYANINYRIVERKKSYPHVVERFVCKGTLDEIKKSESIKLRILKHHFGGGKPGYAKALKFDLKNISIHQIEIIRSLGYGIK